VRYSSLALVRDASPGSSSLRRHLPFALFALALAGLVVALARPVAVVSVPTSRTTILLAIDVSRSMCSSDIPPTRLQAAEAAAGAFIQRQGSATRIGIVAFSGFAEVIQAPTTDEEMLLDALQSLTTGRRTAVGSGILTAIDGIAEVDPSVTPSQIEGRPGVPPTPVPKGAYAPDIIVVLTDGASNTGPLPLDAAQQAADRGIRVYTIGFGTADGGVSDPACAPRFVGGEPGIGGPPPGAGAQGFGGFRRGIDEATLRQVADLTGGAYYPAQSAGELDKVLQDLPTSLILKHDVVELGFAFVAVSLVLAAPAFLLARAWRPLP
jgi:Ca-activated chloride channel family protein